MEAEMIQTTESYNLQDDPLYTVSEARHYLGQNYQRIIYAIAQGWIKLVQTEPVKLMTLSELKRYRKDRLTNLAE